MFVLRKEDVTAKARTKRPRQRGGFTNNGRVRSGVVLFMVISLNLSCSKLDDFQNEKVIDVPTSELLVKNKFSKKVFLQDRSATATITDDKILIQGYVSYGNPGPSSGYTYVDIYIQLEGANGPRLKRYELFNDSAFYGAVYHGGLTPSPQPPIDSHTGRFLSTKSQQDTIVTPKSAFGSLTITSIESNQISGFFEYQTGFARDYPYIWTNCCADYIGTFSDILVE